jgi:hypothetical protein
MLPVSHPSKRGALTIIPTLEERKSRYIDLLAEREAIKVEQAMISLVGEDGGDDLGL